MADAGSLLFQGITQGYQNYQQTSQASATASGQIEALLKQGGPQGVMQLSPDGQKLAQKFLEGNASLKDKMQLLGEANTTISMKQQQAKLAEQQAQTGLYGAQAQQAGGEAALNNARAAQIQRQMQWLQNIMGNQTPGTPSAQAMGQFAQPVGGTGSPPPPQQPQAIQQPPNPVLVTDPKIQAMLPQALRMTLGDPDKASTLLQQQADAMTKQNEANYSKLTAVTKPTGNFYFKRLDYKDGMPQTDVYSPEIMTAPGTASQALSAGPTEIAMPHGQKPPGPVVTMGNGAPDNTASVAGYNPADPEWQSEVADAYNKAGSSAVALGNAKALQDAAQAYTSGNMGGFNAIRGDPKYAKIFQVFSGTNPAAAFKIALAANTQSVLNEIRGPNGSVGGRILQNEYDNTSKVLADATMDNASILAASNNNYMLADRRNNIDQAVAKFRETMPLGEATAMATKMFGLSAPNIQTGLSPQAQASAKIAAPPPPGMVRLKNPAGIPGLVPAAQAKAALAAGYTPVQ